MLLLTDSGADAEETTETDADDKSCGTTGKIHKKYLEWSRGWTELSEAWFVAQQRNVVVSKLLYMIRMHARGRTFTDSPDTYYNVSSTILAVFHPLLPARNVSSESLFVLEIPVVAQGFPHISAAFRFMARTHHVPESQQRLWLVGPCSLHCCLVRLLP